MLDNQVIAVEPLVFDILAYLIEHRERVVTREELFSKLWPGKVVSDAALAARIKDARKAVGDSGSRQAVLKTLHGRGYQFVATTSCHQVKSGESVSSPGGLIGLGDQSPVQYCRSLDGVNIAHASVGQGAPLVITGSWMTHIEEDWENPAWGHYVSQLAQDFRLIRYDQRGNGMSDWDNVDISFDRMVDDLKEVIDQYDYKKVAIFGSSQGAAVSIAYACKYPETVSHLILHGGYSRGRCHRGNSNGRAESQALVTLIRQSWANENPMIRQAITSLMMPEASTEEARWFNEFQKACGPGENMARFREMFDDMDISDLLVQVKLPTLIVHSARDGIAPLSEGKRLAANIDGAKLISLNSANHMLFENEPEFPRMIESVRRFLQ